jgi:hypothetical protein
MELTFHLTNQSFPTLPTYDFTSLLDRTEAESAVRQTVGNA